jgi:hypothetical protein
MGRDPAHSAGRRDPPGRHRRAGRVQPSSGTCRFDEADTLTRLGDTRHAVGEWAQAREAWQQALAILENLQYPDVGEVRAKLASGSGGLVALG